MENKKMDAEELGKLRQKAHPSGTKRYYKNENTEDIIGISGEIAFSKRYNLQPDLEIRPNGDNHIDFKVKFTGDKVQKIFTIDIKTAQKAYNLLIKKWEINKCADILVLAKYTENEPVEFLGWTTKKIMQKQPIKVFSSLGIENYYLPVEKLHDMKDLDKLFSEAKPEQIYQ